MQPVTAAAGAAKQCFVPLVEDSMANMKLLHLGMLCLLCLLCDA